MPDCLIVSARSDAYLAELAKHRDLDINVTACATQAQARQRYSGQRIVFGDPDLVAPLLSHWPAVTWVQSSWAGVLPFVNESRRDFVLTGVKGIFGEQMSEFVIGYLLAYELRISDRDRAQVRREWNRQSSGTLQGKRIGIMGTGSIGQHIARTSACYGMHVTGLSRSGSTTSGFENVFSIRQRDEFLQSLDYLISTLPQTNETNELLDERSLALLPRHAYFINVGRSNVVNDTALISALQRECLAGAVLDVFDEEPLPADSPLWSAPNLRVTAHVSAESHPSLVVPIFVENFRRFKKGQDLRHIIDLDKGY